MCGLSGFLLRRADTSGREMSSIVQDMADQLINRGPDDGGVWCDEESGIGLGHRRLAIVDLSPMGHQPMISASGRYVIAYNGEIYNFIDLRKDMEASGVQFRGHSDTEVLLAAIDAYGIRATLSKLIGMFAFAIWDRQSRTLILARDQLGIKPLYWADAGNLFLFGSELKAMRAHPDWRPTVDRDAVAAFMRHGYIPAPHTIFKKTYKLLPGTFLSLQQGGGPVIEPYWQVAASPAQRHFGSDAEAIEELDGLLTDAVGRQMVADVPLGAFLSGGIDSSLVVALMQKQSARPVKTFSIGFSEEGYNEAQHAAAVAKHFGTDHTELYVTPEHALAVVPKLSDFFDEPFSDSSQIPTFLVSELSRKHVTVALSGDGGDECFGGYHRYAYGVALWQATNRLPVRLRNTAARAVLSLPTGAWDGIGRLIPSRRRPDEFGRKLHDIARSSLSEKSDVIYRRLISHWQNPEAIVSGAKEPKGVLWDAALERKIPDFFSRMQYMDLLTYLPDDILTKVDRATMAVNLESRVPLLDHRVVEFARRLPHVMKVRAPSGGNRGGSLDGMQGKWLLRQVLYRYAPSSLIDRPKMGFGVPIDQWLRGALRGWADDMLSEAALRRVGLLAPTEVQKQWSLHRSGDENLQYSIWNATILQDWMTKNGLSA